MIEERIEKLIKTYQGYIDADKRMIKSYEKLLTEKLNTNSYQYIKRNAEKIEGYEKEIELFEMFIESLKYAKIGE